MKWLKGVVILIIDENVYVELENGRKAWATPRFKLSIREHVLVSWDYTNDKIGIITTKERWAQTDTKRTQVEASMVDSFQNPLGEVFEEELTDIVETSNEEMPTDRETSVVEGRCFPNPLGDEVDREIVVILRDDIKH